MLSSLILKFVGSCLIIIGLYDTNVYRYALKKPGSTFDFFGKELPPKHAVVRLGFAIVLLFYFAVGLILLLLG